MKWKERRINDGKKRGTGINRQNKETIKQDDNKYERSKKKIAKASKLEIQEQTKKSENKDITKTVCVPEHFHCVQTGSEPSPS